jgi:hypothetical protein
MKKVLMMAALAAAFSVSALGANYELFGDAQIVSPGNVSSRGVRVHSADYNVTPNFFGGIDFEVPTGMTLTDLDTLSTDYKSITGGCGGGSPRFVVETTDGGIIDFWWNCTTTGVYLNTGDLTNGNVDTRGGSFGYQYQVPFSAIQSAYGNLQISDIYIVLDGGWAVGGNQTFDFDNTNIDGTVYTYELPFATNANQCKNGGWQAFTRADSSTFKNQGDCVSYTKNGK